MMNGFNAIFPGTSAGTKARVIGRTLIAAFGNSQPPLVWQIDLEKNHSFAMVVQRAGTDWELGVMTSKGEFATVARFPEQRQADKALRLIGKAMLNNPHSIVRKILRTIMIMLTIFAMIYLVLFLIGMPRVPMPVAEQSSTGTAADAVRPGVPADADAVLGKDLGKAGGR